MDSKGRLVFLNFQISPFFFPLFLPITELDVNLISSPWSEPGDTVSNHKKVYRNLDLKGTSKILRLERFFVVTNLRVWRDTKTGNKAALRQDAAQYAAKCTWKFHPMGSRGTAPRSFNFGAWWMFLVNATFRQLYLQEIDPVPIVLEAGWTPGPV
jgi:hypothetical protein